MVKNTIIIKNVFNQIFLFENIARDFWHYTHNAKKKNTQRSYRISLNTFVTRVTEFDLGHNLKNKFKCENHHTCISNLT